MPVWYRGVAAVAVLWSLFGVFSYLQHMGVVSREMTPEQYALAAATPQWVSIAFAIAVFAGLAASLAMLTGRQWARGLFALSLVFILAEMSWIVFVSRAQEFEGSIVPIMAVVVITVAAILLGLAMMGVRKGWLR